MCLSTYTNFEFICVKISKLTIRPEFLKSPRFQFTIEIGRKKLKFLDTTIRNNRFVFDWYHKSTFSGRFLNFHSNHPISQKEGIIFSLIDKVFLFSDCKFHTKNLTFIINILLDNDY